MRLCLEVEGKIYDVQKTMGGIPIMVKSAMCNLTKKEGRKTMVQMHEDDRESGGYFIVGGNEKLMRMLIAPKRNIPLLLERDTLAKCGPMYTKYGAFLRSVRNDGTGTSFQLLYLTDGTIMVRTWIQRRPFLLPLMVVMRACSPLATDEEIFNRIRGSAADNDTFVLERATALLDQGREKGLIDHLSCLKLLGSELRNVINWLPRDSTPEVVGETFLREFICVHLEDGFERVLMLAHMARKVYALVRGEVVADNLDVASNQEVWTSGHIYGMVFKEKLWSALSIGAKGLARDFSRPGVDFSKKDFFVTKLSKFLPSVLPLPNFLGTGDFVANFCSDLQQSTGFCVMAEKLNHLRYTAHFRAVHRGAFFAEMKTTTVRKLMPESWGFMCPVHTPDGGPCGLLNHLAADCKIDDGLWQVEEHREGVMALMESCGLIRSHRPQTRAPGLTVLLDGRVAGQIPEPLVKSMVALLRQLKVSGKHADVSPFLEIVVVPTGGAAFPGVWMFTTAGRFLRQVHSLQNQGLEWIGSGEQPYMSIALDTASVTDTTEYVERDASAMMSLVAQMTPFPDFNQSPRNMYQCQMGKQTMGTPSTNFQYRGDNKMYRLTYGQQPVVRTQTHVKYDMDTYPNGLNAVVAVLAYTGYDMEDAMIINKGAYDRGLASASVYYSLRYDLQEEAAAKGVERTDLWFDNSEGTHRMPGSKVYAHIDQMGLPAIGTKLVKGDVLAVYYNARTKMHETFVNKKQDPVVVDMVVPLRQFDRGDTTYRMNQVFIKLREPRNAIIGDKFSSRHGQKGTLSRIWPHEDMPFTDSGVVPDILINPHAFPSRMTVGMLMESMAGKSGAAHGVDQDGTPFMFSEEDRAVDYFGKQLLDAGYNYYGSEPMYSGLTGTEMQVDIFLGVVYYQRLRHMVGDKFQSRAEGPVNQLTQQPVGGRKHMGGIRVGEMERDSLLAHGASFLINDRLMQSSDYSQAFACGKCGSILAPMARRGVPFCKACNSTSQVEVVAIPFVFRYLATEFAAFGIRIDLKIKPI